MLETGNQIVEKQHGPPPGWLKDRRLGNPCWKPATRWSKNNMAPGGLAEEPAPRQPMLETGNQIVEKQHGPPPDWLKSRRLGNPCWKPATRSSKNNMAPRRTGLPGVLTCR